MVAWHYKEYQREQTADDRKLYASTEEEARKAGRGLWFDEYLQMPSDFRKNAKLRQSEKRQVESSTPQF